MIRLFCVALVGAISTVANAQSFLLGMEYSELIAANGLTDVNYNYPLLPQIATATDAQGFIYLLVNGKTGPQTVSVADAVIKLTPAGDQVVYQTILSFAAAFMAVDPPGNVYLAGSDFVQKLSTDGKTVAYTTTISPTAIIYGLAVDAQSRAYVVGTTAKDLTVTPGVLRPTAPASADGTPIFLARLKPGGAVDYATYLATSDSVGVQAVAADAAGSAYVIGTATPASFPATSGAYVTDPGPYGGAFIARVAVDGSSLIYSTYTDAQGHWPCCFAVAPNGDAVVALSAHSPSPPASEIIRLNPTGTAARFSQQLPLAAPLGLVVDADGNAYAALSASTNFPAKNSIIPCSADGTALTALAVLDASGNVLQSTYIPDASHELVSVGLGAHSTVYVAGLPTATFAPTRQIAGSGPGTWFLASFSQAAGAQALNLACVANAASLDSTGIAGGEIVSLFGQGLGPAAGTLPQVTEQSGYPTRLADVEVTFNGIAAPLQYVQDGQINAMAPWSLQGGETVKVCAVYSGNPTNCITRPVLSSHPGVFMADYEHAVVINQDATINSAANPARTGSYATIFATGLGPIGPAQADGSIVEFPLPMNVLPASMFYWNYTRLWEQQVDVPLQYAGPAPFQAAGVSQINFVVPDLGYPTLFPPSALYLTCGETGASNGFKMYTSPRL